MFRLLIDGIDAYDAYRLSVSDGGYKDFVRFPKLKTIAYNDWHEKNGIDPDLSEPKLDARDINVSFHICGEAWRYNALIDALSDGAYHRFELIEIGFTKRLRLVKCGNVKSTGDLHSFSLTFSDDFPLERYEYCKPTSALVPYYDYLIDGKDVSDYGLRVLQGTLDEIIKTPDVKENLKVNLNNMSGQIYDGEAVTYKSRTVGLRFLMRARSLREFWQNWNALLYDLVRPDARVLGVSSLNKEIPFYYKDCSVSSFYVDNGRVWFEFTLSVEFFNGVI